MTFMQQVDPLAAVPASELPRKFTTINDGLSVILRGIPE
jgi:hypothetical protein